MIEQTRPQRESDGGPPGLGSLFGGPEDPPALVNVHTGHHAQLLPIGGRTIAEVRRRFADRLDLEPTSQAILDGQIVADDVTVRPGQVLMFTHRAGEKGR